MDLKILVMIFNIIICFGIPIGSLVFFIKKKKYVKIYFVGMAVFFISQIIIRLPIMCALATNDMYLTFSTLYPVLYVLILSFTAGLFEETGRYIGFKVIKEKTLGFKDAIAFGIGHGGIEAMLLVGMVSIQNLLLYLFSKDIIKGEFFLGYTKEAITRVFDESSVFILGIAGVERIFAMIFHIVATIVVLYSVRVAAKKYLFLAIGIHTVFNFIAVIVTSTIGIMAGQVAFLVMTIILIVLAVKLKESFEKLEGREVYEKID
ncbi:MAG: YhfC family glutamic-type intramembrane protease [Sarcina sp.]